MTNNTDLFLRTAAAGLYSHGCKPNKKSGQFDTGEPKQERSPDLKCQILYALIIHVGCCSAVNLFNTWPLRVH